MTAVVTRIRIRAPHVWLVRDQRLRGIDVVMAGHGVTFGSRREALAVAADAAREHGVRVFDTGGGPIHE
jgi:hypothetical protein